VRKFDIKYDIFNPNSLEFPVPKMEVLDTECYRCGAKTRHAVPTDFIDYKLVADDYKEMGELIMAKMNQMIADINVMHSDNPILDYINNEHKTMISELRDIIEGRKKSNEQ